MIEWNFLDYNPVYQMKKYRKDMYPLVLLYKLKSQIHFFFPNQVSCMSSIKTLESEATWRTVDSDQMTRSEAR